MRKILLLTSLIFLVGCASWIIPAKKVVLLPEERIFTIPAGQEIKVLLDKKPITMTFPYDMKLVSSAVLVAQEQRLNDAMFKKIKSDKKSSNLMAIVTAGLGAFAGISGLWLKNKATKKQ